MLVPILNLLPGFITGSTVTEYYSLEQKKKILGNFRHLFPSILLLLRAELGDLVSGEKWNISCHISKQGCHKSSEIASLQCELVSPDGTQDMKT